MVVAGLMVESELSVAVFAHPTLDKLPDDVPLPAASALARMMGSFMQFWYALVCLLTSAAAVIEWRESRRNGWNACFDQLAQALTPKRANFAAQPSLVERTSPSRSDVVRQAFFSSSVR